MTTNTKRRRAYIGNLRPRPALAQNLYSDLFIPHCLSVNNYPNGDGITIIPQKGGQSSTAYAFVEFTDVDYAVQMLNGVKFDGKTLRVSREKTNFGKRTLGGFGSSRWASADCARRDVSKQAFQGITEPKAHDEVIDGVRWMVSKEVSDNTDKITSAIACTAAVSLLSSIDAFGLDGNSEKESVEANNFSGLVTEKQGDNIISNQDSERGNQLPLSDLPREYGEQDLDWKKHTKSIDSQSIANNNESNIDFMSRCKMPLSDLLAEYGEQDVNWKTQHEQTATNSNGKTRHKNVDNGMLTSFENAFIHLELVSFGYKYGAPSHSKKGFTYTHPLPPIDTRDLDRAPGHVAKFNGLSYLVKKALLNPSNKNDDDPKNESDRKEQSANLNRMRKKANEIADDIVKILVESIDDGGHGPISPLTMTISIGSEYGRHRAVVLVEHLAIVLRARLRRNDGKGYSDVDSMKVTQTGIVKQLVSVETRHRDIDARHKDEEAFGEDLKRELRAAEKAKRRQHKDEIYW